MSCEAWSPEVVEGLIDTALWGVAGLIVVFFFAREMFK